MRGVRREKSPGRAERRAVPTPDAARGNMAAPVRSFFSILPVIPENSTAEQYDDTVIQLERVPTFFSYVFGRVNAKGEPPVTMQGPHTVAHAFIEQYLGDRFWTDLFEEQIAPYPAEDIVEILKQEERTDFPNYPLYLSTYSQLYAQLLTWRRDGTLDRIDQEEIEAYSPLYNEVQQHFMRIMEMHPYGSYGWNRGDHRQILNEEIKGKGESRIDIRDYEVQADLIIDPHAQFNDMDRYEDFLQKRLPMETIEPEDRNERIRAVLRSKQEIVRSEFSALLSNIRGLIGTLTPAYSYVAYHFRDAALPEAARLFHDMPLSASRSPLAQLWIDLPQLDLLQRHHEADLFSESETEAPLQPRHTLNDIAGDLLGSFAGQPPARGGAREMIEHYDFGSAVQPEESEPPSSFAEPPSLTALLPLIAGNSLISALDRARRLYGTGGIPLTPEEQETLHAGFAQCASWQEQVHFMLEALALPNRIVVVENGESAVFEQTARSPDPLFLALNDGVFSALSPAAVTEPIPPQEAPAPESGTESGVWVNNCLITAIVAAMRHDPGEVTEQQIRAIRTAARVPLREFLTADALTIAAIRNTLGIPNTIIVNTGSDYSDLFEGTDPVLYLTLRNGHFQVGSLEEAPPEAPAPEAPAPKAPPANGLIRALDLASMQQGGGMLDPNYLQINRIRRQSGTLPGQPLLPDLYAIGAIRLELKLQNPIVIVTDGQISAVFGGDEALVPLWIRSQDDFFSAMEPELAETLSASDEMAEFPQEELIEPEDLEEDAIFPDHLIDSIDSALTQLAISRADIDRPSIIESIQTELGRKRWSFLTPDQRTVSALRRAFGVDFSLQIFEDGRLNKEYLGDPRIMIKLEQAGSQYVAFEQQEPQYDGEALLAHLSHSLIGAVLYAFRRVEIPQEEIEAVYHALGLELHNHVGTDADTLERIREAVGMEPVIVLLTDAGASVTSGGNRELPPLYIRRDGDSFEAE